MIEQPGSTLSALAEDQAKSSRCRILVRTLNIGNHHFMAAPLRVETLRRSIRMVDGYDS
jgi:hypothetical protein